MDPFQLTLTSHQAAYLQKYLPTSYSFQTATLQSKRQRTAKKIDESFTSEFTLMPYKKISISSKNNLTNSVSQKVIEDEQVQNRQAEGKRQNLIKTCDKEVIKQAYSNKKRSQGNSKALIEKLLRMLKNCNHSWPFCFAAEPIVQKVSNHSEAIKQSLDLKTVENRFKAGEYCSFEDFDADIRKIIANSYKSQGQDIKRYAAIKEFENFYMNAVQLSLKKSDNKVSSASKLRVEDQDVEKQQLVSQSAQKPNSKVKAKEIKTEKKNGQKSVVNKQKMQLSEFSVATTSQKSPMNELNFRERQRMFNKIDKLSQQNLRTFIKLCGVKTSEEWSQMQIDLADLSQETFRKIEVFLYEH